LYPIPSSNGAFDGPDRFALNVSFGFILLSSFTSIVTGFVSSLEKINEFLVNRGDILSENMQRKLQIV